MSRTRWSYVALSVGVMAVVLWCVTTLPVHAQWESRSKQGKEVTVTGRVVDLHGYMTGKYESVDRAKCTADCIRNGVPAGVETESEMLLLGQGSRSAAKTLEPLAFQEAEIRGTLYEKNGVKYLDVISAKKKAPEPEYDEEEEDWSNPEDEE
ncbi:MAG: hypothetical protein PVI86_17595 [Phycisphaerae bacterium]